MLPKTDMPPLGVPATVADAVVDLPDEEWALLESAIVVASSAAHGQLLLTGAYRQAAHRGAAKPLLADPVADVPGADTDRRWPDPDIGLVSAGWEPMGFGAIQDLLQAEFGPVDFDRSPVRLTPPDRARPDGPACAGAGFGFPADLHEHIPAMCAAHAAEAKRVSDRRLKRAAQSNRRGWAAIAEGVQRLEAPPPLWRLSRWLRAALEAEPATPIDDPDALRTWVRADAPLILDLAARFTTGAPFRDLLEQDEELAWRLTDWLTDAIFNLGKAGQDELLVPVGEAVQRLDPDNAALHVSDLAVALAERGRPEALEHTEASVRACPDDVWLRIHLGDVHRKLGDPTRAEAVWRAAAALVAETGVAVDVEAADERLTELLAGQPGREDEVAARDKERTEVVRRYDAMQRTRRRRSGRAPRLAATSPARAAADRSTSAATAPERMAVVQIRHRTAGRQAKPTRTRRHRSRSRMRSGRAPRTLQALPRRLGDDRASTVAGRGRAPHETRHSWRDTERVVGPLLEQLREAAGSLRRGL